MTLEATSSDLAVIFFFFFFFSVWQLHGSGQCYVTLNTSATDAENWEKGCRGCLERFQLQLKTALCNAPEMGKPMILG